MPRDEVALEINRKTRSVAREGRVISQDRSAQTVTVRWSDGSEESMKTQKLMVLPAGGLRHRQWTRGQTPSQIFASDPVDGVLASIRDLPEQRGTYDAAVKALTAGGADEKEVRTALKEGRSALEEAGVVFDTTKRRLKLDRSAASGAAEPVISSTEAHASTPTAEIAAATSLPPTTDAPATQCGQSTATEFDVPQEIHGHELDENLTAPGPPMRRLAELVTASPARAAELATSLLADPDPVIQLLRGVLIDDVPALVLKDLVETPLASGRQLGDAPVKVISEVVSRPQPNPLLLALLACTPSELKGTNKPQTREGAKALELVLRNAIRELGPTPAKRTTTQFDQLLERAAPVLDQMSPDFVVDLLVALPGTAPHRSAEQIVAALTQSIRRTGKLGLDDRHGRDLARYLQSVSLGTSPAKQELLARLHLTNAAVAVQPQWWTGVTADDLLALTNGRLLKAIGDPQISKLVAPLVQSAVSSASTRRRLMALLAAPPEVAALVDAEQVSAAMTLVASSDRTLSSWRSKFAGIVERSELEEQIARLTAERDAAIARASQKQSLAEGLQNNLKRAQGEIDAARQADRSMREAQERQLRIDPMRTMARLAVVAAEELDDENEQGHGRIDAFLRRQGLEPIGDPGEITAYNPKVHETVERNVTPGTSIKVTRCGYTWTHADEQIVLVRALVETPHE